MIILIPIVAFICFFIIGNYEGNFPFFIAAAFIVLALNTGVLTTIIPVFILEILFFVTIVFSIINSYKKSEKPLYWYIFFIGIDIVWKIIMFSYIGVLIDIVYLACIIAYIRTSKNHLMTINRDVISQL